MTQLFNQEIVSVWNMTWKPKSFPCGIWKTNFAVNCDPRHPVLPRRVALASTRWVRYSPTATADGDRLCVRGSAVLVRPRLSLSDGRTQSSRWK